MNQSMNIEQYKCVKLREFDTYFEDLSNDNRKKSISNLSEMIKL